MAGEKKGMKHYPRELKLEAMRMFFEEGMTRKAITVDAARQRIRWRGHFLFERDLDFEPQTLKDLMEKHSCSGRGDKDFQRS
jgi:hypothetical protein